MTQEDYRDAICYCRQKICVAKAQLELTSIVEGNRRARYVHSKLTSRDNTGLLLEEEGHLTNRDTVYSYSGIHVLL